MGSWKSMGVHNPVDVLLLLTDGTFMAWATRLGSYRLMRPSKHGEYSSLHTTVRNDLPGADNEHTGAVLLDGRVYKLGMTESHVYDPVTASWSSAVDPVTGTKTNLTVLSDGRVMLENQLPPCTVSLLDTNQSWTQAPGLPDYPNGGPRVLLPDGRVFALTKSHVHLFDPLTKKWLAFGNGPSVPPQSPALLLPDGRVLLVDTKTAKLHYFTPPVGSASPSWTEGTTLPATDSRGWSLKGAMGALCLLPSGKVLCGAEYWGSDGIGNQALVMYELDLEGGSFSAQENPDFVRKEPKGYFETPRAVTLLLLPSGQVYVNLIVDPTLSNVVAKDFLYTPTEGPAAAFTPTLVAPESIRAGAPFLLSGYGVNGLSQAVSRMPPGGEQGLMSQATLTSFCTQGATNYPLVQFEHQTTVSYLRTSSFSSLGVATGAALVTFQCEAPADLPTGPGRLRVVANGVPSAWHDVNVMPVLDKARAPELAQLVIALLGGGEGGLIVLTPHGLKRIPPGSPIFPEVRQLSSRIAADLQRLTLLGESE